jgi:LPXTG-site transpeptidase (sortase) family protein
MNMKKTYKKILIYVAEFFIIFIIIGTSFYVIKNWEAISSLARFKAEQINNSGDNNISEEGIDLVSNNAEKEDKIIIPRIKAEAPVLWDIDADRESEILEYLKYGIIHFPKSSFPEENENIILVGHSSGIPGEAGEYDNIFSLISELKNGDLIAISYKGKQFDYNVFDKRIIKPRINMSEFSKGETILNLVTCWPLGTNFKRLVVMAK